MQAAPPKPANGCGCNCNLSCLSAQWEVHPRLNAQPTSPKQSANRMKIDDYRRLPGVRSGWWGRSMCHLRVQQCFLTVASTAERVGCCALLTRVEDRLSSHLDTARRTTDLRQITALIYVRAARSGRPGRSGHFLSAGRIGENPLCLHSVRPLPVRGFFAARRAGHAVPHVGLSRRPSGHLPMEHLVHDDNARTELPLPRRVATHEPRLQLLPRVDALGQATGHTLVGVADLGEAAGWREGVDGDGVWIELIFGSRRRMARCPGDVSADLAPW